MAEYGKPLSPQQIKILTLASKGLTSPQVADTLCVSSQSVRNIHTTIKEKLGASTFIEAIMIFLELMGLQKQLDELHELRRLINEQEGVMYDDSNDRRA